MSTEARNLQWHKLHLSGKTYEEIATTAKVSRNTVASSLFGFRKKHKLSGRQHREFVERPVKEKLKFKPSVTVENLYDASVKDTCRFIEGDPLTKDAIYCGHVRHNDLPYCIHHARICYTKAFLEREGDA